MVNIKLESSFRDFDKEEEALWHDDSNEKYDYMEKHFPDAVLFLYFQMLWLEVLSLKFDSLEIKKAFRREAIKGIQKMAAKNARERIKLPKGRTPVKEKHSLYEDKKKFIEICFQELKRKQKENEKLTRTKIAESVYGRYANPLQELRKKLKLYEISFEELIKKTDQQP